MPEEINRVSPISSPTCSSRPRATPAPNLLAEGIDEDRIVFVGNVDDRLAALGAEPPTASLARVGLTRRGYAVATLHRPANVDTREALAATLDALEAIGARLPWSSRCTRGRWRAQSRWASAERLR